jgi:hypothetical protein
MVATIGSERDVMNFVMGKTTVDPKEVRVEEWVKILRSAIEELPLSYLRGLKSLKQMFESSEPDEPTRIMKVPSLLDVQNPSKKGEKIIPNHTRFLVCATTQGNFPKGASPRQWWLNAPRSAGVVTSISQGFFLLSKKRTLYYVLVKWVPNMIFGGDGLSSVPEHFWYEGDPTSVEIIELDDKKLDNMLGAVHERDTPVTILISLYMAIIETSSAVKAQYDHVLEKRERLGGYLKRIGSYID